MSASNATRRRPPPAGLRQLATRGAMRTLVRSPRWFLANLRQGPEFLRDQRREQPPSAFGAEFITTEAAAVASVLQVPDSAYRDAIGHVMIPEADPDEPLSVWNAREELLRVVGTLVTIMRPDVMVETGVALGFTTATVLWAMKDAGRGRLYSVDLPALQFDPDEPVGRAVPAGLRARWELTLGDSREVLGPLVKRVAPLDVFLHDALHTYTSQLREYRTAWPYL